MALNSKEFIKSLIIDEPPFEPDKYIIYEMVHLLTNNVFYVGRTKLPLHKRIMTHFSPKNSCKELALFIQQNRNEIRVRVIQVTASRRREKYWVKKRATEYKLFNKDYLISRAGKGGKRIKRKVPHCKHLVVVYTGS